jgi:microcystin-dependent protein
MAFEKPIWQQNNTYSARLDRQIIQQQWYEGVISGMRVKQRAAGAQMNVQIEDGAFVIYGDDQANQGAYLGVWYDDATTVTITAAPGSNSRWTVVWVRVNDPNATGPAGDNFAFGTTDGVAAASPVVPAIPTSAIALANVLVTNGNIQVIDSMITTVRAPAQMKGAVPIGATIEFNALEAAIPTDYVAAFGQAINRNDYWQYMAVVGTIHGVGDGLTTVNVPDHRGRVGVGLDNMGGVDAARLSTANTLGLGIGAETVALVSGNLPPHAHSMQAHTHSGTTGNDSPDHTHTTDPAAGWINNAGRGNVVTSGGGPYYGIAWGDTTTKFTYDEPATVSSGRSVFHQHGFTSGGPSSADTGNGPGTSTAVNKMQPGIMVNKIIKVR